MWILVFFVFAKQSFSGVAYIVVVYTVMFSVASLYLHRVSSGISRLTMGQPCHSVLISPFQATAFSVFGNPTMIKEPTISIHFCWSKLQKHFIFPASRRIFHSFLGFSSKKKTVFLPVSSIFPSSSPTSCSGRISASRRFPHLSRASAWNSSTSGDR